MEGSSDFSPIISSPEPSLNTDFDAPLRRSQRSKHPLAWLKDFICINNPSRIDATQQPNLTDPSASFLTTCSYPLLKPLDLAHLSSNYVTSLAAVLQIPEPNSYAQAKLYPE